MKKSLSQRSFFLGLSLLLWLGEPAHAQVRTPADSVMLATPRVYRHILKISVLPTRIYTGLHEVRVGAQYEFLLNRTLSLCLAIDYGDFIRELSVSANGQTSSARYRMDEFLIRPALRYYFALTRGKSANGLFTGPSLIYMNEHGNLSIRTESFGGGLSILGYQWQHKKYYLDIDPFHAAITRGTSWYPNDETYTRAYYAFHSNIRLGIRF